MELIIKFAKYLNNLTKKQFHRFLLITISSAFLIVIILIYFIHQKSTDYIQQIKLVIFRIQMVVS